MKNISYFLVNLHYFFSFYFILLYPKEKLCVPLFLLFHRTIIYLSIVYAIGQVAMAISAINDLTDSDRDGAPNNMAFHV